MEADSTLSNIPAISLLSNNGFGTVEHAVELDFSYLESICGCHVFTKEIHQEMTQKQQWEKGFGLMKKTLNLAIETGRIEELYKIHDKLIKEMESEVTQIVQGNETTEFACTISNPISIRKKGRKPKIIYDNDHGELPHKRLQKALQDNLNT
ncbi:5389_t:CDS:2, partial [Funneliformis caledonium]